MSQARPATAVERRALRPAGKNAATDVPVRPSTPQGIAAALGRFAVEPPAYAQADLRLLVDVGARVGLAVLQLPRLGLRRHLDLGDPGMGYDAIAEAFLPDRDNSGHLVLCRHAREIVLKAGGDPDKAAIHFRNKMAKFARNRAKQILKEVNPGGAAIRRNVLASIDPAARRRTRICFLPARDGWREPIPSVDHVRELCRLCGAGEWRVPLLLEATHVILVARRHYAPWIDISQLECDYLEVMTVATLWPYPDALEDDSGTRMDAAALLRFWREKGQAIAWERFRTRTELPLDDAKRLFGAYLDYFDVWVQTADRVERWEFVQQFFPDIDREAFRRLYRRALDGLHQVVLRLLAEWFERREEEVAGV